MRGDFCRAFPASLDTIEHPLHVTGELFDLMPNRILAVFAVDLR